MEKTAVFPLEQLDKLKEKLDIAEELWLVNRKKCYFCEELYAASDLWRIHSLVIHTVEYLNLEENYIKNNLNGSGRSNEEDQKIIKMEDAEKRAKDHCNDHVDVNKQTKVAAKRSIDDATVKDKSGFGELIRYRKEARSAFCAPPVSVDIHGPWLKPAPHQPLYVPSYYQAPLPHPPAPVYIQPLTAPAQGPMSGPPSFSNEALERLYNTSYNTPPLTQLGNSGICPHSDQKCRLFPRCKYPVCPYLHPYCPAGVQCSRHQVDCPFDHGQSKTNPAACCICSLSSYLGPCGEMTGGLPVRRCPHVSIEQCSSFPQCFRACPYGHPYCTCSSTECIKEHPNQVKFCDACYHRYVYVIYK